MPADDYTPTTEQVRRAYVTGMRQAFIASAGEHAAEFDRFLEARDARVRRDAAREALAQEPTEEQVEVMARMATEEVSGCDWESFGEDARDFHRGSARRRLTAALRAAYATGGTA